MFVPDLGTDSSLRCGRKPTTLGGMGEGTNIMLNKTFQERVTVSEATVIRGNLRFPLLNT